MNNNDVRRAETLKEFCRSLGVSEDSGWRAVKSGKLKSIRFGHRILVPAAEIERVLREGLGSEGGAKKKRAGK